MQPQACRAGDVSAAPCLQVAARELAAATRLRQAMPLSACIRFSLMGPKLKYAAVATLPVVVLQNEVAPALDVLNALREVAPNNHLMQLNLAVARALSGGQSPRN